MTNLRDMNTRMQQWMNEKPSFDNGNELRVDTGDLVIFQFCSNGDDGDKLIKIYRSHVIPMVGKNGNKYNAQKYCPAQSNESDIKCIYCEQGHLDIKERMSIWMAVSNILHYNLPKEKQFPQTQYQGRLFFNEEVNGFKVWHTSAWRESPWNDIVKLAELYQGLHNFTAQLEVVGAGLQRRYKVYAIPQSAGMSPELYARAQAECESIMDMLHAQLAGAVVVAPNAPGVASQQTAPSGIQPFAAPGTTVPALNIGGVPASPITPPAIATSPTPAPTSQTPTETLSIQQETDQKRPMKSFF